MQIGSLYHSVVELLLLESNMKIIKLHIITIFFPPNGRYINYLSLIYVTNKSIILKVTPYTSVSQPFRRRGTLDLALHISRYPLRKTSIFLN